VGRFRKGFVRAFKQRHPATRQRQALLNAGVSIIYEIGEDGCMSWRAAVRSLRKGDELHIEALALLPDERKPGKVQPAADLIEALDEIRDKGAVVVETSTGRRSDNREELKAMRADAIKALGAGGRSLPSAKAKENGGKGGRRPKQFSARDMERAELVWNAIKKYPRWQDVRSALPEGFTADRAYKLWGARGGLPKSTKR
jgi:hypothetical protein